MRNEKFTVGPEDTEIRVDVFLAKKIEDYSRSFFEKLITDGGAEVNGRKVKPGYKLKNGDLVEVSIPDSKPLDIKAEKINLDILYEDNDIIVVNKPKGMVVHPAAGNYTGTLVNALMEHCGDSLSDINGVIRPGIVHRIDKDTSGVLVAAKNNSAHMKLSEKLKDHNIQRIYVAVAEGVIAEDTGKIDAPVGRHPHDRKKMSVNVKNGRRAVTYFKVIERFKSATLLELKLETGRTHQIRVHLSYIGHPLIGDTVYGRKKQQYDYHGQALHAKLLGFEHPSTGEYMEFTADPPAEFNQLLKKLRKQ